MLTITILELTQHLPQTITHLQGWQLYFAQMVNHVSSRISFEASNYIKLIIRTENV